MFDEKNLSEEVTAEEVETQAAEEVSTEEATGEVVTTEGAVTATEEAQEEPAVAPEVVAGDVASAPAEGPKSKANAREEGREKAKAKRQAKRDGYQARAGQKEPKEKLKLTAEEKAERREAKALASQRETAKAVARHIRMSPMKVNLVLDLIRGRNVDEALAILDYTRKDAAVVIAKVLRSAVANAENNQEMDRDALYVTECHVGPGPTLKRYQPRAQGRAFQILKRSSHITVVVAERD